MTASKISGFDDYCKALSGADDSEIAYLMLLLRGWMIKVQSLEHRIEEEKSEYVDFDTLLFLEQSAKEYELDELSRIADNALSACQYISKHMRERIVHENTVMPIYQAREISSSGLRWLSRKPGRNFREKLSSSNNILAVKRYLSADTGENRLYLAFVKAMAEHIEMKRKYMKALVTYQESDFLEWSLRLIHNDEVAGIGRWENLSPNNTLLSDRHYRTVWHAWTDLQNLDEMVRSDYVNISDHLCTFVLWCLLHEANKYFYFVQQPVRYNYTQFTLEPLFNQIMGHCDQGKFSVAKRENVLSLNVMGEQIVLSFEGRNCNQIVNNQESITALTRDNIFNFVKDVADICFGAMQEKVGWQQRKQMSQLKKADVRYMDAFSLSPYYLNAKGNLKPLDARILYQQFNQSEKNYGITALYSDCIQLDDRDNNSRLYSIRSCIQEKSNSIHTDSLSKLIDNLRGCLPAETVYTIAKDVYNEFQLSEFRRSMRIYYNHVIILPRSLAILFQLMQEHLFRSRYEAGDFVLLADYDNGECTFTLVQGTYDKLMDRAVPETQGIIWERHPTYRMPVNTAENVVVETLQKNGLSIKKSDNLVNIFGVDGLQKASGAISFITEEGNWNILDNHVNKDLENIYFNINEQLNTYKKMQSAVIGKHNVHIVLLSKNISYTGRNVVNKSDIILSLRGLKQYDYLMQCVSRYSKQHKDIKLEPLWSDQLPELAIKRLYGSFELISDNDANRIKPRYNEEQEIKIPSTFTLPKGQKEYHFGLIMDKNDADVSYEAVIRHPKFPLSQDVRCALRLTYTYGKDNPYRLEFMPMAEENAPFKILNVEWERQGEVDYRGLIVPEFPEDNTTWEDLQHGQTLNSSDKNFLEWVVNSLQKASQERTSFDLYGAEYHENRNSPDRYTYTQRIKNEDGNQSVISVQGDESYLNENGVPEGRVSCLLEKDSRPRDSAYVSGFRQIRNGSYMTTANVWIDGKDESVAFFDHNFIFKDEFDPNISTRVSFHPQRKRDDRCTAFYISLIPAEYFYHGSNLSHKAEDIFTLNKNVFYPLHTIYANGRTSMSPDCPSDFQQEMREIIIKLPVCYQKAAQLDDEKSMRYFFRVMCVMALEIGQPVYDLADNILDNVPDIITDDLGCALGDYDRSEQQQLFYHILDSRLRQDMIIKIMAKAAWKSDGFIKNAPAQEILKLYVEAVKYIADFKDISGTTVLPYLEYILAVFRLRSRQDDDINKILSLNFKTTQRLYRIIENMIDRRYRLPESRVKLEVEQSPEFADKNIPDFLYALLVYITGSKGDAIRITKIISGEE